MSKTLYVSDLDGTLLRGDQTISPYSLAVVNDLIQRGMRFSFATARSLITASKVAAGLHAGALSIVYNGAFIVENGTGARLRANFFPAPDLQYVRDVLGRHGIHPLVYALHGGAEKFSYRPEHVNAGMRFFLDDRRGDARHRPVTDEAALYEGEGFYVSCIGEEAELAGVHELLRGDARFHCIYQRDIYSLAQWLEILPAAASKASAVLQLRDLYGLERVVCFGDGRNDLTMFRVADECYAVANAHPDLKAIATAVIESNEEDGVAKWLAQYARP